jgi:hypothetical protein
LTGLNHSSPRPPPTGPSGACGRNDARDDARLSVRQLLQRFKRIQPLVQYLEQKSTHLEPHIHIDTYLCYSTCIAGPSTNTKSRFKTFLISKSKLDALSNSAKKFA